MKKNYLVFDTESTIRSQGNPFNRGNKLCYVGLKDQHGYSDFDIEYGADPYGSKLKEIKERIECADLLIGFHLKHDLHWIRRYIPDIRFPRVFCCQLAEFVLSRQTEKYPSLNGMSERLGTGQKLDVVYEEYWKHGIDTPLVPKDILTLYLKQDVELTWAGFLAQLTELTAKEKRLLWLQNEDLLLLADMEFNGMRYNFDKAAELGDKTKLEVQEIDEELRSLAGTNLNFGSTDQLSCLLYGGRFWEKYREQYTRTLKDGTVKEKERWSQRPVEFPKLVEPLKRTETKPTSEYVGNAELQRVNEERMLKGQLPFERHWSVGEKILRRLRARGKARRIITLILKRAELEKLDGTYYSGLIKLAQEMDWSRHELHGRFNQCVARTGRLSSAEPNLQNFSKDIKELFYTRYD